MQLQELRDAKQRLEIDLNDKKEAWDIDVACRGLESISPTLEWKAGSTQMRSELVRNFINGNEIFKYLNIDYEG